MNSVIWGDHIILNYHIENLSDIYKTRYTKMGIMVILDDIKYDDNVNDVISIFFDIYCWISIRLLFYSAIF